MDEQIMVNTFRCTHIVNFPIIRDRKKMDVVGRAIVVTDSEKTDVLLLDICIFNEADRRRGLASELLTFIKDQFPSITTMPMTKAGLHLCLKNGFKLDKSLTKNGGDVLIYDREEDNDAIDREGKENKTVDEETVWPREGGEGVLREPEQGNDKGNA